MKLYIDLFLVVVILCIHSLILLFSAGDGRRRHHRCIPAADRRLLLNPVHLFGSHFQIFLSVTFTVPLLVSDYYYYDYDYSSLHLKMFLMVPSGVVWGCFMYCLKLDWTLCMSTVSAGQAGQGFFWHRNYDGPTAFYSSFWRVSHSHALFIDSLVFCKLWSTETKCSLI